MTSLIVENIAKEEYDVGEKKIGPNVIEATIGNVTLQLPDAAAMKSEIDKAEKLDIRIDTKFIQYFYQVQNRYPITNHHYRENITKTFADLMVKYPNHVSDINFDFVKDHIITSEEIDAILRIQKDVKSPFLSIIEPDKEQSLEDFTAQLENIENPHDQIVCPSIDLDTKTPGLVAKKIACVLEKKYPRFNVKYSSLYTRYNNWLDLSEGIFGKDVWCNITSIPRGYFNGLPPHRSLLACTFLYGVHTASHGYGRRPKKSGDSEEIKKPDEYTRRLLDPNSFYYNETDMSYNQSIINSMNNICSEMKKIRQHVIDNTFVTKYLPRKSGLQEELDDLKGRM